jgi:hypothetical protein
MHSKQSSTARAPPGLPRPAKGESVKGNTYYANFTNQRRHHAAV